MPKEVEDWCSKHNCIPRLMTIVFLMMMVALVIAAILGIAIPQSIFYAVTGVSVFAFTVATDSVHIVKELIKIIKGNK